MSPPNMVRQNFSSSSNIGSTPLFFEKVSSSIIPAAVESNIFSCNPFFRTFQEKAASLEVTQDAGRSFSERLDHFLQASLYLLTKGEHGKAKALLDRGEQLISQTYPLPPEETKKYKILFQAIDALSQFRFQETANLLNPLRNQKVTLADQLWTASRDLQGKARQLLILDMVVGLAMKGQKEFPERVQQILSDLREKIKGGQSFQRAYLDLGRRELSVLHLYLSRSVLKPFLQLASSRNDESFSQKISFLGRRLRKQNMEWEALRFSLLLKDLSRHSLYAPLISKSIDGELHQEMRRVTGESSQGDFGSRVEFLISKAISGEKVAHQISTWGGVLGLASIFCSYLRPLRSLSAAGVHFLSQPSIAGTLLLSGSYLLYKQAPLTWEAGQRVLDNHYAQGMFSRSEDLMNLAGFFLGGVGLGIGLASFGMGGGAYFAARRSAIHMGYTPQRAMQFAYMRGDAVRRAVMDPEIWSQYARGNLHLRPWQRIWLEKFALVTNGQLIYGSAALGLARLAHGAYHLNQSPQSSSLFDYGNLILFSAMDFFPGVSILLYRAARGNHRYNLGPALSQELTEAHYRDPHLQRIVKARIEKGLPPLKKQEERDFTLQAHVDLDSVEQMLLDSKRLRGLAPAQTETSSYFRHPKHNFDHPLNPGRLKGTSFSKETRQLHRLSQEERRQIATYNLGQLREAYESGRISPVGILQMILHHPSVKQGAIFPHPLHHGPYRKLLQRLAEKSEQRFKVGKARPLEGVFVAVKDLFPALDKKMYLGSKTARVTGTGTSPVVEHLVAQGAIPIPVGMVAAANGGSGMFAGFGYVHHPTRQGFDPGGSSSGTAHVLGLEDFPVVVGIGTDTGGSVTAPGGAVGLSAFVPPQGVISTKNMIPFDTYLDRVGVLSRDPMDAMVVARYISGLASEDPHMPFQNPGALFLASPLRPRIVYLKKLIQDASPQARRHFLKRMERLEGAGYQVTELGKEWNFLAEVPLKLYPFDAYTAAAFTHANPLRRQVFDPPRRTLDENVLQRLNKGVLALENGYFDRARSLSQYYREIVREKLGEGILMATPAPEAIPTHEILAGRAGNKLDGHDRITMPKNRLPEWGQLTIPAKVNAEVGISLTGHLPDLAHMLGQWRAVRKSRPSSPLPSPMRPPALETPSSLSALAPQLALEAHPVLEGANP